MDEVNALLDALDSVYIHNLTATELELHDRLVKRLINAQARLMDQ